MTGGGRRTVPLLKITPKQIYMSGCGSLCVCVYMFGHVDASGKVCAACTMSIIHACVLASQ